MLSQRYSKNQKESLIDSKTISAPAMVGNSKIYCYCGSVMAISGIEVVVTSENTNHLGSISGTSVSGRIRRLSASFNSDGTLHIDHLQNAMETWKSNQLHKGPYSLGICVAAPPYNSIHNGIQSIIHAVALEKRDTGVNLIESTANRKIYEFVVKHCVANNFSSVFIPVFGLGSGGILRDEAISKALQPLVEVIHENGSAINFYLGTYRTTDAALLATRLLKIK